MERATFASEIEALIDTGESREAMCCHINGVNHGGGVEVPDSWLAGVVAMAGIAHGKIVGINRAIEQYRLPETLAIDAPTCLLTGTHGATTSQRRRPCGG